MNGIILIVTKTWTRDEAQPGGSLENLIYSMRKSMVVSVVSKPTGQLKLWPGIIIRNPFPNCLLGTTSLSINGKRRRDEPTSPTNIASFQWKTASKLLN
jgi:hypothetical protein